MTNPSLPTSTTGPVGSPGGFRSPIGSPPQRAPMPEPPTQQPPGLPTTTPRPPIPAPGGAPNTKFPLNPAGGGLTDPKPQLPTNTWNGPTIPHTVVAGHPMSPVPDHFVPMYVHPGLAKDLHDHYGQAGHVIPNVLPNHPAEGELPQANRPAFRPATAGQTETPFQASALSGGERSGGPWGEPTPIPGNDTGHPSPTPNPTVRDLRGSGGPTVEINPRGVGGGEDGGRNVNSPGGAGGYYISPSGTQYTFDGPSGNWNNPEGYPRAQSVDPQDDPYGLSGGLGWGFGGGYGEGDGPGGTPHLIEEGEGDVEEQY